jgi:hypothetical protein
MELGKLFGEPFDLLLRRRTYDIFAAYWPYAEGGTYDDRGQFHTSTHCRMFRLDFGP